VFSVFISVDDACFCSVEKLAGELLSEAASSVSFVSTCNLFFIFIFIFIIIIIIIINLLFFFATDAASAERPSGRSGSRHQALATIASDGFYGAV
jgi:hypothetical protein